MGFIICLTALSCFHLFLWFIGSCVGYFVFDFTKFLYGKIKLELLKLRGKSSAMLYENLLSSFLPSSSRSESDSQPSEPSIVVSSSSSNALVGLWMLLGMGSCCFLLAGQGFCCFLLAPSAKTCPVTSSHRLTLSILNDILRCTQV